MTGGAAIVRALLEHDVDTVFGLPGVQMYPLYDALHAARNRIRTISSRHEQGAAYMAFGYAQSSGRPGVYTVVPGPGMLNTTAALATAWGCNTPVLCITGQIPSEFIGRRRGHLHELPDQLATVRSLVKWAARIEHPSEAPRLVAEAFRQMASGRPGPVSLEMAWDVMASEALVQSTGPLSPDPAPIPDPVAIDEAARLLAVALRPMIMVGGGARHAGESVLALAEALNAPVMAFRSGRGVLAEDHELSISCVAARELWPETDVLLGIGSRLELPYVRWAGRMGVAPRPAVPRLIRIDIDPTEMTRLRPDIALVADAKDASTAVVEALDRHRTEPPPCRARVLEAKATAAEKVAKIQPQVAYLDVIRRALPADGILVEELCQVGYASFFAYPVLAPRAYMTCGFEGTLGYGFPSALGVKLANPERRVVSLAGDGGFMFGVQELATAAQYGIGLVTLVFNNGAFGNVKRDQQTIYDGRVIGSELTNPDFVALAESFGVDGHRVAGPETLEPVLAAALAADRPALIEVMVEPDSEPAPWDLMFPR